MDLIKVTYSDQKMDKLVHQMITAVTLKALNLEPSKYQLLLDASIEPDKHYEQDIERCRILEKKEVEDIEKRYESKRGDNVLNSIGIWLSKQGNILSTRFKSIGSELLQYTSWAIEHGSNAKENAVFHFDVASNSRGLDRLINLGHCLHYVADLGTPYHSKKLEEVGKIPSGTPKERYNQVYMDNLLKFSKSVFEDHKIFEMELASFCNTDLGKSVCQIYLNLGFNSAKKKPFTRIAEARTQFLAALAEIEKISIHHCNNLDNRFIARQPGGNLSQEDRETILKAGLDCLAKIAEASYISTKAFLLLPSESQCR